VPSLAEAVISQRQAYQATLVAEVLRTGDVLAWDELGIYRTLIQLPKEELTESALHPGLVKLRSSEGGLPLLETLECFLDLAGDVKATAAKLMIHRATLYYRLGRIEELADTDLSNGEDRLLLHLGLKIVRLAGLYPKAESKQSRIRDIRTDRGVLRSHCRTGPTGFNRQRQSLLGVSHQRVHQLLTGRSSRRRGLPDAPVRWHRGVGRVAWSGVRGRRRCGGHRRGR
jgi:hypothetical protein